MLLTVVLMSVFTFGLSQNADSVDNRRPFYNIGHMVNSIKELSQFLDEGCNAIESDVSFAANGTPLAIYHGMLCDCFRYCDYSTRISTFLKHVHEMTIPGNGKYRENFSLLLLDLKTMKLRNEVKHNSGRELAKILIRDFFDFGKSESKLNILLAVYSVDDSEFVVGFNKELEEQNMLSLNKQIGWEVSDDEPVAAIENMWNRISLIENIWYSDGITNCLSLFRDQKRLRSILKFRNGCKSEDNHYCPRKVYQWTIDYKPQFRLALRRGVDGIITNEPAKLSEVLAEDEFKNKFRLAQPDDNPWTVFR